jgi:oligo-1,6-glucosidase
MTTSPNEWWKDALIYQVYPRSFKDSDGDGIGDLKGILSELDYIVSLGIDTLWINPVYQSPGHDNGYDISDFMAVEPQFGTMEDLDELIRRCHVQGLRLIMDMVINHTSDQHEWFRQARLSRDNPYYGFYIWWAAELGEPPARIGFFDPEGKAWTYNKPTDSYYLHYFSPQQPDLDWDNPEVRKQLYEMLRFWLDKGVDGLRFDALTFISKNKDWPEITPELLKEKYQGDWGHCYADGPHLHEYLQEMNREVLSKYDAVAIAEASGVGVEQVLQFVAADRQELDLLYHFDGVSIGYLPGEFKKVDPQGYSRKVFKEVYTQWSDVFEGKGQAGQRDAGRGWGTIYLGNHDQPRMISRWGDDSTAGNRIASAKLLFTFLLTMRATPFLYNGDELGMVNIRFSAVEDYEDIETRQMYELLKAKGGDAEGFLRDQQLTGRDNSRTPFQWTPGRNAGFTDGKPWLKVNEDHAVFNRQAAQRDPDSILHYVRRLIRFRKEHRALVHGEYRLLDTGVEAIYAYSRTLGDEVWTVVLNLSGKENVVAPAGRVVLNNYSDINSSLYALTLYPWQALVFKSDPAAGIAGSRD